MDLNFFVTQVRQTNADAVTTNIKPETGDEGGLKSLNNIDNKAFWDALLGNLAQDGATSEEDLLNSDEIVLAENTKKETVDLALLQLGLLGQDADKTLDEKISELKIEQLVQTEENRAAQLTKMIDHLTSGLPQEIDGSNATIEDLISRLSQRLETLESSLDAFRTGDFNEDEVPFKLLIATGLNPAEFTKITNRIDEVETKLGRKLTVEDLIAGVGNIIPVPNTKEAEELSSPDALNLLLRGLAENKETQNIIDPNKNNTGVTLNDVTQKIVQDNNKKSADIADVIGALSTAATQSNIGLVPVNGSTSTSATEEGLPLPQNISNTEFQNLFGKGALINDSLKNINTKNTAAQISFADKMQSVATLPPTFSFDASSPLNFNDMSFTNNALSEALGFDIQTGAPFTQTMLAAHTTTMAQSAHQPHPGTNMVAAQMKRVASGGEAKQITLQLDPPELGRVEVRMEFGNDKKVTTFIVAEKNETLLMLQRDQAALERALQNAGLDTDSSAMNFELAQEDYGFGSKNNGRDGNSGTQNARHNGDDDGVEIIETNIDWNIDPQSGHVRYNIIA